MKTVITRFAWVYAVLFLVAIILVLNKVSVDSANAWNWGWIIISLQMVYLALSFRTVGPTELAALLVFGRPECEVKSGLAFVPFLICDLSIETGLDVAMQIPGNPEDIDKAPDNDAGVKPGKVLPIRLMTASPEIAEEKHSADYLIVKKDPLNKRMAVEATAQFRLKIVDYLVFLRNIGSMDAALKQLRDTAEGVLKGEFTTRTPPLIYLHWTTINQALERAIDGLVRPWGVDILNAQLIDVDLTKAVHTGLRDALNAELLKTSVETAARAEKEKRVQEGQGAASAEFDMLKARADAHMLVLFAEAQGLRKLAKLAGTPEGQIALLVQQAKLMYTESDYSILPGNGDGLLGAVAGIQEVLKKIGSPKAP